MTPQSNREPFNVWEYKPWWCQPWSIVLTSITLISGSWALFRMIWVTALVSIPVLVWMGFFVVIYPRLMAEVGSEDGGGGE